MSGRYSLLTEASAKTVKGEKVGFLTGILYLSPSDSAGIGKNVCPFASAGCIATCLNTAGRAGIMRKGETTNAILEARKRRTKAFFTDRAGFIQTLHSDISKLVKRAERIGMKPAVRLNGTSDLRFEIFANSLFRDFPQVTFYDYTKDLNRVRDYVNGILPRNYYVTFSFSERATVSDLHYAMENGVNVAAAYTGNVAEEFRTNRPNDYVDGDLHDLRFLDYMQDLRTTRRYGKIVWLTAKGKAKKDTSGFVVRGDS
jgi:hypothetical protein